MLLGVGRACRALRLTELRHHRAMSLFDAAKAINEGVWLIVALGVAVELAASRGISAGGLTTYFLLYTGVVTPLRELHRIVDEASESSQQAVDLQNLRNEPEDDVFRRLGDVEASGVEPADVPYLVVENVRFGYAGKQVLAGVSLCARRGEHVAIVGPTTAGKLTLAKIVLQLEHGAEGVVAIDGHDVRALSQPELRERMGYVAQQAKVFNETVRWNITLGREDISESDLIAATSSAQIHEDILGLPNGYDTVIAERGESLSGGQRQRICLARALVRVPALLILDEPTAALDGRTEAAVQSTLDELRGTTLLVIAHRLSTLRRMDRIYVMSRGSIVQQGNFATLAAMPGLFRQMLDGGDDGGEKEVSALAA